MGSVNNTDNLGTRLKVGDHVGYVYGSDGHYRIHSGIVEKLCDKRVWIMPDDFFKTDARIPEEMNEWYETYKPDYVINKFDRMYAAPYGRVVKLGY